MQETSIKLINIGQLATYDSSKNEVICTSNVELVLRGETVTEIKELCGPADTTIDCQGGLVTPGFVDPHTHPVFLKGRQEEFALRIAGASYQDIAKTGGGIQGSIEAVRRSSVDELVARVTRRMDRFLSLGTTTVEAKSGYGLDLESELKSLEVLDRVNHIHPMDIIPTFMGGHDFPQEFKEDHNGYIEYICSEMIPEVARQGIAVYCDVFCEKGYFDIPQTRRILESAREHGLQLRIHADEFEDSSAAELAAEIGVASADHLMAVSEKGIRSLAQWGIIATLLPGTTFFLGQTSYAPARRLIHQGVDVALATDFNPGSSHIQSMPFIMSLGCLYLGLTVEEAFMAATFTSARALGIEKTVGSIEIGKQADLLVWNIGELIEIPYSVGEAGIMKVIKRGKVVS